MKARDILYFLVAQLVFCLKGSKGVSAREDGFFRWAWSTAAPIVLLTIVGLFYVNAAWAFIEGKLMPDADPVTRTFLEDWPNLINYSILCPTYVALGILFVIRILRLRQDLQDSGLWQVLGAQRLQNIRMRTQVLFLVISALVSAIVIARYASELPRYPFKFWFQPLLPDGTPVLTAHAVYYLMTNYVLNFLVVLVIILHVEFFHVAWKIGGALQSAEAHADNPVLLDHTKVVELFRPFNQVYALSKLLVLAFLVNLYTWRAQQPSFLGMLDVSVLALAVLGAAVVSYPRYHVQYGLYRVWKHAGFDGYPDIRDTIVKGMASLVDVFILGGAMTNLLAYVLHKSGLSIRLW